MILKQTWWDNNLSTHMNKFLGWVSGSDAESKIYFRNFIKASNIKFKNCLDVGCGPATEYLGFQQDSIDIEYTGVDSSVILNNINVEKGIPMIQAEGHSVPVNNNSYDLVFSRHVLEHQLSFEPILEEGLLPDELINVLKSYLVNPSATSTGHGPLVDVLKTYDASNTSITLHALPENQIFLLKNLALIKGKLRRTRYFCKEANTGKLYLVAKNAQVTPLESNEL